jgi:copper chaperone NosL
MRPTPGHRTRGRWRTSVGVALALLLAACRTGPQPIAYGRDECAWCHMQISDARYAAELVTNHGRALTFDSIECLVSYYESLDGGREAQVSSLWVSDYAHPGTLIPAATAHFLRAQGPGSPMGRGMLAVASDEDARQAQARTGGSVMTWADVVATARRERWSAQHAGADAMEAGRVAP